MSIIDILSIGASISTILGVLIAIVTLVYLYFEKKEKLETQVRQAFIEGKIWRGMDLDGSSINLIVQNETAYRFSGNIKHLGTNSNEYTFFFFNRLKGKKIIINVHKRISGSEDKSCEATLIYISRNSFWLILDSFYSPSLPSRMYLYSLEV